MEERARELVAKLNFDECAALLEKLEGIELFPIIMDRMEELDEARFLEYAENF